MDRLELYPSWGHDHPRKLPEEQQIPGDPRPREIEAYQLIGRVVTGWTEIQERIYASIELCRTTSRLKRQRAAREANPNRMNIEARDPTPIPARVDVAIRYLAICLKVCVNHDAKVCADIDEWAKFVPDIYFDRNLIAHGSVRISAFFEEPAIMISSRRMMEKARREIEVAFANRRRRLSPKFDVVIYFSEMERMLAEQRRADEMLIRITATLGFHFGPPVDLPAVPK